ncbi:MAG: invasion associated locus B family protein [Pseudomonadota bacterium]
MIASKILRAAGLAAFATTALAATQVAAQQQQGGPGWAKVCSKAGENDICVVQYNLVTPTNQLVTGVNLLTSKGTTNRRLFQVAVPTGRYIPQGVKMKIDAGPENTLPYAICLPDRCTAEIPLDDRLVAALKGGGELTLTSTNFRAQSNPVKVSLSGFTAAFDGPPLKQNEVDSRNKEIADELKKKADAARQKLLDAQEKAKTGG